MALDADYKNNPGAQFVAVRPVKLRDVVFAPGALLKAWEVHPEKLRELVASGALREHRRPGTALAATSLDDDPPKDAA